MLAGLSIVTAPAAKAQVTFAIDEFTASAITFTIVPGSLLTGSAPSNYSNWLSLVDGGLGDAWAVNAPTLDIGGSTYGTFGGQSITSAAGSGSPDYAAVSWGSLSAGTSADSSVTLRYTGSFDTAAVSNFALYWGFPSEGGVFQSSTANPSAVPEPSTYAAIFGAIALLGTIAVRKRVKRA